MSDNAARINRGLIGVVFDRSAVSRIDGSAGTLHYYGYSIDDLAEKGTFEEVAFLLLHGDLPNKAELAAFRQKITEAAILPGPLFDVIRAVSDAHPMDVLRTIVSALPAFDPQSADTDLDAMVDNAVKLIAQTPVIIAAHDRIRRGLEPLAWDSSLGYAANWLWMLKGERPSADAERLADLDFILHAEHGSNASSFTARVVIGTEANLHAAITAAISALSGPAHGGAAEDVMKMAIEIGEPENAADYVKAKRKARVPVTGFGHRVYKTEDPRARHMRDGVERLSRERGEPKWFEILQACVDAMAPYARHGINVNVDFYSGVIYHLLGIQTDLFVPIFAIGRVPGWAAQCLEQRRSNILIRPLTEYNGPEPRAFVALDER